MKEKPMMIQCLKNLNRVWKFMKIMCRSCKYFHYYYKYLSSNVRILYCVYQ